MNRHLKDFCVGFSGPIVLAILLYLLLRSCAVGASVELLWNPSPDSRATGYAVYYGLAGSNALARLDVGNATNAPVNGLQVGRTYFFYVTAYDADHNESDPSNVLDYTVSNAVKVTLWYCSLLQGRNWVQVWATNVPATNAGFWKLRISPP